MRVRCGDIFDAEFVAGMISFAQQADLSEQTKSLLTLIHGEAVLGCSESGKSNCLIHVERPLPDDSKEDDAEGASVAKRLRLGSPAEMLPDTSKQCRPVDIEADLSGNSAQDSSASKCDHSSLVLTQDVQTSSSVSEILDNTTKQHLSGSSETGSSCNIGQDTSSVNTSLLQTKDAEMLRPNVMSPFSRGPMFYYCLHRRRLKNVNLPK